MDYYYYLKSKLECHNHPLKYSEEGIAVCAACDQEYEVKVEIKKSIDKDE